MAAFTAIGTSFSFPTNLSSVISGHVDEAVTICIVCAFVCVFPSCQRHYGFLEDEEADEKHLRRAHFGWCSIRKLRSWSKDGVCKMGTYDANVGCIESPEWSVACVRIKCSHFSTLHSWCGTDAAADTATMRKDSRHEDWVVF